jgi:hypothetical protein
MDTIQRIPTPALSHLHMDPEHPVPGTGDGMLLKSLPAESIDEITRTAGASVPSPLLSLELRQLGGELRRARSEGGALAALDAEYALYAVGIAPTPPVAEHIRSHVEGVMEAVLPWAAEHAYLNFAETRRDPGTLWTEPSHQRLRHLKTTVDPDDLIHSNHPVR